MATLLNGIEYDYLLERRLREVDPLLHKRFTASVFGIQNILSNYKLYFPEYTDHTELHSLTVLDFCNRLIGDQIEQMDADEIYVLLMSCYFHDTGMGISAKDYEQFCQEIDFGDYFETHDRNDIPETIRSFHNEFSGRFIRKYAPFFDIPSDEHLDAIVQVSRGHRKTDLMDESVYPVDAKMPNGNTVCYPYLAALIRLADEIDVTSARNSALLYDIGDLVSEVGLYYNKLQYAVKELVMEKDRFIMIAEADEPEIRDGVYDLSKKVKKTLDICRAAVNGRTPYEIRQSTVEVSLL